MSDFPGDPLEYDFGTNFNYAVWPKSAHVDLVNVPWNNDYRDTVKFNSRVELDAYIDSLASAGISVDNMSYIKPNEPIRLNLPFNVVYRFNYLRVKNPIQPVNGNDYVKNLYYFITDVQYIAPNTTQLNIQLDIWQTFIYDVTIGNCYIERGHIGIANTNQMNNFGRDYLAIPEGLDTGAEYRTAHVEYPEADLWNQNWDQPVALIVSTVDLQANAGNAAAPVLTTAKGGIYFGIPSGASMYAVKLGDLPSLMYFLQNTPWVSQGIISITILPMFARFFPSWSTTFGTGSYSMANLSAPPSQNYSFYDTTVMTNWRNNAGLLGNIPSRYQVLKKFLTAPYMMIELTTHHGTAVFLRPENWQDSDAKIRTMANFFPPDQRILIFPIAYNSTITRDTPEGIGQANGDDGGSFIDTATMIGDFPSVPIVNNMALNYLAANKNGIAFQYQNADWSQQRALASNQTAYDQASFGIDTTSALTQNANALQSGLTGIQNQKAWDTGSVSYGAGVVGAALSVNPGGLANPIANLINTTIDNTARTNSTNMQNTFRGANTSLANQNTGYIRDTNKNLADWAAKGDYSNAIAGINAKVQDSKLTEPSMSGQLGGSTFNMANNNMGPCVRWKMIDPVAMTVIGEYWLRYGYAIRKFITPPQSLSVMSKFTYWKMQETYISAATMPEAFKQGIRGILEKGVTVWVDPNDIGNIDIADNVPLAGVSY